jgi:serine O-acetyltransferase
MRKLLRILIMKRSGCSSNFVRKCCSALIIPMLNLQGSYIGGGARFESMPVFPHGIKGVFISSGAEIGNNNVIFHQVTIGSNTVRNSERNGSPKIGDNCYIGAGAKIIGKVTIGNNVRIGANCVVVKDVPDNCTVVSQPCRIIQKEKAQDNQFLNFQE